MESDLGALFFYAQTSIQKILPKSWVWSLEKGIWVHICCRYLTETLGSECKKKKKNSMKRELYWHSDILNKINQFLARNIIHTFHYGPTQDVLPHVQTWKVTVVTHWDKYRFSAHAVLISQGIRQGTSHFYLMVIALLFLWQFSDFTEDATATRWTNAA